jgi:hypothetical protein
MQPTPVVVRIVGISEARELERDIPNPMAMIAGDPHLAGVEDAHTKQLAVILVRKRQELRHGTAGV